MVALVKCSLTHNENVLKMECVVTVIFLYTPWANVRVNLFHYLHINHDARKERSKKKRSCQGLRTQKIM